MRRLLAALVLSLIWWESSLAEPNILLIIGDDLGVEALSTYRTGEDPPTTETLDSLAADGMQFSNFWSQPVCSPTRATVLTGRYGFRTGIGAPVGGGGQMPEPPAKPRLAPPELFSPPEGGRWGKKGIDDERSVPRHPLLLEEYTLPRALKNADTVEYSTAAIGKWHLAGAENGGVDHPNLVGFDHFSGLMGGGPESYYAWNKVTNGVVSGEIGYAPHEKTNDAIEWIQQQGERPWFLWFAFNLAHTPLHLPPEDLLVIDHSELDSDSIKVDRMHDYFKAMVEAMDAQMGRLLASLDPDVRDNTYVVFMGDNGTEGHMIGAPFRADRAKGTIYEGGINVPLIISGPDVPRGAVSESLVNSTDLFATILDMAGVDPDAAVPDAVITDSISFLPNLEGPQISSQREWIYADYFFGGFSGVENADYAIRNARYKLVRYEGIDEFYDLADDPYETQNLLEVELSTQEAAEYQALEEQVSQLRGREES